MLERALLPRRQQVEPRGDRRLHGVGEAIGRAAAPSSTIALRHLLGEERVAARMPRRPAARASRVSSGSRATASCAGGLRGQRAKLDLGDVAGRSGRSPGGARAAPAGSCRAPGAARRPAGRRPPRPGRAGRRRPSARRRSRSPAAARPPAARRGAATPASARPRRRRRRASPPSAVASDVRRARRHPRRRGSARRSPSASWTLADRVVGAGSRRGTQDLAERPEGDPAPVRRIAARGGSPEPGRSRRGARCSSLARRVLPTPASPVIVTSSGTRSRAARR